MANIWKENSKVNEHPNRNHFDLSYQNHLTMQFGKLYPIMCKEVVPGDTFKIDTAFGLKFMPMPFPVQSKMTAYVHYFYVRNKNLWKNWENWVTGLEEHEHPYIHQPARFFQTGTLADYMDIPTTLFASATGNNYIRIGDGVNADSVIVVGNNAYNSANGQEITDFQVSTISQALLMSVSENEIGGTFLNGHQAFVNGYLRNPNLGNVAGFGWMFPNSFHVNGFGATMDLFWPTCPSGTWEREQIQNFDFLIYCAPHGVSPYGNARLCAAYRGCNEVNANNWRFSQLSFDDTIFDGDFTSVDFYGVLFLNDSDLTGMLSKVDYVAYFGFSSYAYVNMPDEAHSVPLNDNNCPFSYFVQDGRIRLSALPFRAYESIYNAYYRNTQNQPFYINGVEQFNRYITTDEDGADSTNYQLFSRNYEQDWLTSSMPSPQFGNAPLVGMTALGNITIEDENGITTATAEIDNDGTITGVTLTSPAASIDHARTAMNIAQAGMSINDFRNVNALQRWAETVLRKGYKYMDQIAGHFGVSPSYRELDMPEFIGGVSQNVTVSQVTNMASTESIGGKKLGEIAGMASCFGATKHTVNQYCDDYGFIIGVLCVVPTPSYSQMLPKHWLKRDKLDYYFPEFAQIGMQPITYEEVTPIQSFNDYLVDSDMRLTDSFGYQRPNYDLVAYNDQVHGLFRSDLSTFLIQRIFDHRPELSSDFLKINPVDTNQIFTVTNPGDDNILGQVVINIDAVRPVPRITIPSLGK